MDFHRIKILLSQHTPNLSEWKGAVLFLCNEEYVFLIKRSENMPSHGGQIAFVGGHRTATESDPWEVARREFEEETGLSADGLEYLGFLPTVMTARLQPIVPVVARLLISNDEFFKNVKSNGEWDVVIAYPWQELFIENNWNFAWRYGHEKSAVMFHSIKSGNYLTVKQNVTPHILWGATAQMIWGFLRLYFNK
jgi:8-oxo-dGTP pyrophosphatase MutT (NUDIX family)